MRRSLIHGLVIDSPIDLPGGAPSADAEVDVRLHVRRGRIARGRGRVLVRVDDAGSGRRYALVQRDGDTVFSADDCLDLVITPSSDVEVVLGAETSFDLARLVLAGPGLAAIGLLRGHHLLHASACHSADGVVAIFGPAGAGKSTLARMLTRPGHGLFSDDVLRTEVLADGAWAHRGTTTSRLRSAHSHATAAPGSPPAHPVSVDGRILVGDVSFAPAKAPLRLLVRPRLSPHFDSLRLTRLPTSAAVAALSESLPLEGVHDRDLLTAQFERAAVLARRVPVMMLDLPWGPGRTPPQADEHVWRLLAGAAA